MGVGVRAVLVNGLISPITGNLCGLLVDIDRGKVLGGTIGGDRTGQILRYKPQELSDLYTCISLLTSQWEIIVAGMRLI